MRRPGFAAQLFSAGYMIILLAYLSPILKTESLSDMLRVRVYSTIFPIFFAQFRSAISGIIESGYWVSPPLTVRLLSVEGSKIKQPGQRAEQIFPCFVALSCTVQYGVAGGIAFITQRSWFKSTSPQPTNHNLTGIWVGLRNPNYQKPQLTLRVRGRGFPS